MYNIFIFFTSLALLVESSDDLKETGLSSADALATTLKEYSLSIIFLIYCGIASFFIIGLLGYHSFLLYNNLTTNEQIKDTWKLISGNPFKMLFFYFLTQFHFISERILKKK